MASPLAHGYLGTTHTANKKTDVIQCLKAFDHVGLLFNEPPGEAELPFIWSSDDFESILGGAKARLATARWGNVTASTEKGKWIIVLARRLPTCGLELTAKNRS